MDNQHKPIICIVGPPACGKTHHGEALRKYFNRKHLVDEGKLFSGEQMSLRTYLNKFATVSGDLTSRERENIRRGKNTFARKLGSCIILTCEGFDKSTKVENIEFHAAMKLAGITSTKGQN